MNSNVLLGNVVSPSIEPCFALLDVFQLYSASMRSFEFLLVLSGVTLGREQVGDRCAHSEVSIVSFISTHASLLRYK